MGGYRHDDGCHTDHFDVIVFCPVLRDWIFIEYAAEDVMDHGDSVSIDCDFHN